MKTLILFGMFTFLTPKKPKPKPAIPIMHHWIGPPSVVVCPNSPVSLKRVKQAMDWTAKRGARWSGLSEGACETRPESNEIYVMLLPEDDPNFRGAAGVTMSEVYILVGVPVAASAIVAISPKADPDEWVMEHELLHAQGVDHHTMTESVMCRSTLCGGWDDTGIPEALDLVWSFHDSIVGRGDD